MEVKNQPCSVLFTFSTVNLHLEDIPLIPGTCHTLQADELWSSKPVLSAVHWLSHWKSWSYPLTHAAGYVVTRNGLQKHLLPAKLSHNQSSQACRMWSQEPLTVSDWAEDGWWLCILIGFWCEHLLQWPVKLMTCCNSSVSQKTVRQANPDGGTSHYNKETLQCMAYGWQTLKHSGPKAKTKSGSKIKAARYSATSVYTRTESKTHLNVFFPVFTCSWQQAVVQRSKAHKMTLVGCDLCKSYRPSSSPQKG